MGATKGACKRVRGRREQGGVGSGPETRPRVGRHAADGPSHANVGARMDIAQRRVRTARRWVQSREKAREGRAQGVGEGAQSQASKNKVEARSAWTPSRRGRRHASMAAARARESLKLKVGTFQQSGTTFGSMAGKN
eukprot:2347460-Pleurochrysis_carterae.AAC.1